MFWNVLIFVICTYLCGGLSQEIEVQTHLGKIRGITDKSRKGSDYYSFRGIRYAEPPVGENRFLLPMSVKPWNGTLDATRNGFICPQGGVSHSLMSEDCLILNVYTKDLNSRLPVLFFIHGGYFTTGGSHSEIFWNPRYLMDKDIVVVTINYRLGPFGFINSGSEDAPGNLGLKDQVFAMQWVRDNIKYFGGDPNKVTISGNSAGGISVTLHMVSPMSRGLFHGAIVSSGSGVSHFISKNQNITKKLGESLNCPMHDPKSLVQCLRTFSWSNLISSFSEELTWIFDIEEDFGQEQFLSENPIALYGQGKIAKVPVLVGITKDEYEPVIFAQFNHSKRVDELNTDFYKNAPDVLWYDSSLTSVTETLRSFYLKNESITSANLDSYARLASDAYILHGIHKCVNLARKHTDVFYYRVDYQGRYSWDYDPSGKPYGVSHADDLLYLFVHTEKAPMFTENDPENIMIEKITTFWSTFVQTGNPNNKTNPWTSDISWEPCNKDEIKTLYVNEKSYIGPEPFKERMELWDNLFLVPN